MKPFLSFIAAVMCLTTACSQIIGNADANCGPVLFVEEGVKTLAVDLSCNNSQRSQTVVTLLLVKDLSLMAEKKDTVVRLTRVVELPKGEDRHVSVKFRFNVDPGFYETHITWLDGDEKKEIPAFNIGCEPEKIISEPDAPADFDEFWAANLAELAAVPMNAKLTLLPDHSDANRNVYRVEMKSLGGVSMGGYYAEPVAAGTYPAYVEYMGYGAEPFIYDPAARPDAIEFLVSVRGQGIFMDEQKRWCDRGLDSKENFYYKGAFCDCIRAIDFVASREKTDQTRIFAKGESQGGAFTFVSASLDRRLRAASPAVPFLGDFEDYAKIVSWPVWEMYDAAEAEGISRESLHDMLRYFDVKNFTSKVECPIYMSFGLQDPTCPPHTNFSEYNQVRSEKKYYCVPLCGHAMWQVPEWSAERDAWFEEFE